MKAQNILDGVFGSGLFFITSGQVQRAIGKQNLFQEVSNPAERVRKIESLSKLIEKEINDGFTVTIKRKDTAAGDIEGAEVEIKPK